MLAVMIHLFIIICSRNKTDAERLKLEPFWVLHFHEFFYHFARFILVYKETRDAVL